MRPGPRRSISQTEIVAAAFELLDRKGMAAVSVRGVAAALGLTPTAMYTYFPSKGALLSAMLEELLGGIAPGAEERGVRAGAVAPSPASDEARDEVAAKAAALRRRLRAHPAALALVTSGGLDGSNATTLVEAIGADFLRGGLAIDDAARAAHDIVALVLGQSAIELAWRGASAGETAMLWEDAGAHPITDAATRLGLHAGAERELDAAVRRAVDGWLASATSAPAGRIRAQRRTNVL